MYDVGAKIFTLKHLKLHGKMLLADEKRAIVGSINLTPGSFDARQRASNRNFIAPRCEATCRDIAPGLETFTQTRFVR